MDYHLFVYVSILCFGEQDKKDVYMLSLANVLGHACFIYIKKYFNI